MSPTAAFCQPRSFKRHPVVIARVWLDQDRKRIEEERADIVSFSEIAEERKPENR